MKKPTRLKTLREAEVTAILAAVRATNGSLTLTAKVLDVSRAHLIRKIAHHDLTKFLAAVQMRVNGQRFKC